MIVPDLNLLLYAYNADAPEHHAARRWWEDLVNGAGGNLVIDAHIAALAIEYQAEVHSNDSDFGRFPGVRWRNPL